MALGRDLMTAAMIIGGGYVLIYYVLPGLQSGQFGNIGGGGTFLPPAAAALGGTKCWEIGNGKRACSCQGKQHFVMGDLRTCDDCTTHCAGGTPPDRRRLTSNPPAPKQTGSGPVPGPKTGTPRPPAGQISPNCRQASNYQYCWKSGNLEVCMGGSCETARQYWLQKYGSKPAPRPPAPAPAGARCTATPTGFGSTKLWKCNVGGRTVTQGIGWRCQGRTASELYAGATCYP